MAVEVGNPVPRQNGNYSIPFSFVVENTGIVDLCDVSITDDLTETFGIGNVVSVTTPATTGGLVANPNYDGENDVNLLVSGCNIAQSSRLPADSDAVAKIVIEVTPIPGVELYTHSATVAAKSSDPSNPRSNTHYGCIHSGTRA